MWGRGGSSLGKLCGFVLLLSRPYLSATLRFENLGVSAGKGTEKAHLQKNSIASSMIIDKIGNLSARGGQYCLGGQ
jgi:hypothetical protein